MLFWMWRSTLTDLLRGRERIEAELQSLIDQRSNPWGVKASKTYHNNPTALHVRAMNLLYEGLEEKGALMLVPSSAVESMGMGGLMGAAALHQQHRTGGVPRQEG